MNVDGTKNIIKNLKSNQKIIFASTDSCYGSITEGFCNEETPLNSLNLYGRTKARCENLLKQRPEDLQQYLELLSTL